MSISGTGTATAVFVAAFTQEPPARVLFDLAERLLGLVGIGLLVVAGLGLLSNRRQRKSLPPTRRPDDKTLSTNPTPSSPPPTTQPEVPLPPPTPRLTFFTLDLLQALEWRAFERLIQGYFRARNFEAQCTRTGADGGVDIEVRKAGSQERWSLVQCKAWNVYPVGVKPVRELFGVMAAEGMPHGYFVTTGRFTSEAEEFAKYKPLKLVSGEALLERLNALPPDARADLFDKIYSGDYTTPTCPSCDVKMVLKDGKHGTFWACPNYGPKKCCQTFRLRKDR